MKVTAGNVLRRFPSACLLGLLLVSGIQADDVRRIPGFQDGSPFLVRVVSVRRTPPPSRPWEYHRLVTDESAGFFVDGQTLIAGRFPPGDIVSVQVRLPGVPEPFEAEVLGIEPEMQIAVIRIIGRPVSPTPPVLSFVADEKLLLSLRQVDCVSRGGRATEVRTAFLKRPRPGPTPSGNATIPLVRFSGWEGRVAPGDVLVSESAVVGIVTRFSPRTRIGSALPATLVASFLEAVRTRAGRVQPVATIETDGGRAETLSVLPHPGFEAVIPTGAAQRLYLGSNRGGVIVTRVLPFGGAATVLVPGDIVVSVRGQAVSPGGTITDPLFGPLPVESAIVLEGGRFVPSGTAVRLTISRQGDVRDVSFPVTTFASENRAVASGREQPRYWILAGLALVELTDTYVSETGGTSRLRYLATSMRFRRERNDDAYVVLHQVLPTKATSGYESFEKLLVIGVNGTAARNLKHLRELVEASVQKKFPVRLMLEGNREIVMDGAGFAEADAQVRTQHGIQFLDNLPR